VNPENMARQGSAFCALTTWILSLNIVGCDEDGSLSSRADEAMLYWLVRSVWTSWTPMGVLVSQFLEIRSLMF